MGGTVSSGEDNAELVDKLVEGDYIKDQLVERVFRAVDRGDYFFPDHRESAYKDQAWKQGNVHLSAPCIYAEVMEWLKLGPGMSFLNLGSGTGYLSTLAGLILGSYGVNHGVEYYQDVIDYAEQKLEQFIKSCELFDEFEFCEPVFIRGNCLLLSPSCRLYDRLYCGAACPSEHESYMKNLIKVGGILVMPLNDQLVQVTRVSETQWETKMILPVTFARLISPYNTRTEARYSLDRERLTLHFQPESVIPVPPTDLIEMPSPRIMSLLEISRLTVRRILIKNIREEHPNMNRKRPQKAKKKRQPPRKQRRINMFSTETGFMFDPVSDDSDWENSQTNKEPERGGRTAEAGPNNRLDPSFDLWNNQMKHALLSRFFSPRLLFLPTDFQESVSAENVTENHDQDLAGVQADEHESAADGMEYNTLESKTAEQIQQLLTDMTEMPQADTAETEMATANTVDAEIVIKSAEETEDNMSAVKTTSEPIRIGGFEASERERSSYSSGVETCSSVEADSIGNGTVSSIFWTKEFLTEKMDTDNSVEKESASGGASGGSDATLPPDKHCSTSANEVRVKGHSHLDLFHMTESQEDDLPKMGAKASDGEQDQDLMKEATEAGNTIRTYLRLKVDQLPVPVQLKNYLLFYRN